MLKVNLQEKEKGGEGRRRKKKEVSSWCAFDNVHFFRKIIIKKYIVSGRKVAATR